MATRQSGAPDCPEIVTLRSTGNGRKPTKAEMKREFDMPKMSEKDLHKAFFNPTVPGRPKRDRE